MTHPQDGLPATALILLATALLLFGAGGGLVGYMAGERQGEQRATAVVQVLGAQWDAERGKAQEQFKAALGDTAARLEKSVGDIRAQIAMYHGCGSICAAVAYQFGEEVLRARDDIGKTQLAPLADWNAVLRGSGITLEEDATEAPIELGSTHSKTVLLGLVAALCVTVILCFGLACFTILKLRAAMAQRA